jgi:hypothetical protein
MKAVWNVSRNNNDTVVVESWCVRCGTKHATAILEPFQHGGPCGIRVEFPPEQIREQYAELKEAERPRIKLREPSPNLYQPQRFWLHK